MENQTGINPEEKNNLPNRNALIEEFKKRRAEEVENALSEYLEAQKKLQDAENRLQLADADVEALLEKIASLQAEGWRCDEALLADHNFDFDFNNPEDDAPTEFVVYHSTLPSIKGIIIHDGGSCDVGDIPYEVASYITYSDEWIYGHDSRAKDIFEGDSEIEAWEIAISELEYRDSLESNTKSQ